MKKLMVLMITAAILVSTIGCGSGIAQSDYDSVVAEKESLSSEVTTLKKEVESVKGTLSATESTLSETEKELAQSQQQEKELAAEKEKIQAEYDAYKEKMKPYEEMTVAQAEAEKAQAEAEKQRLEEEAAAKKAAEEEEKRKAEEEAAAKKAAEEAKGYETGITYEQLARTPDDYTGKKVKFKGKVIQLIEDDDTIEIRFAVNSNYDTILYCGYDPKIVSSRVLEDDVITIYGTSIGLISYESTLGGKITIPAVLIDRIDQ